MPCTRRKNCQRDLSLGRINTTFLRLFFFLLPYFILDPHSLNKASLFTFYFRITNVSITPISIRQLTGGD